MKVLAEGVETQDQLDLLAGFGCELYQGYLFSLPISADEFAKLLEDEAGIDKKLSSRCVH